MLSSVPVERYAPNDPCTRSVLEFVSTLAELSGLDPREARDAARDALAKVGAADYMTRPISSYSKGMRQRTKIAQSIVQDIRLLSIPQPLGPFCRSTCL